MCILCTPVSTYEGVIMKTYTAAKVIIHHPDDPTRWLLIMRRGHCEPAGGRVTIDFSARTGESLTDCAIREAYEELGVRVTLGSYLGDYHFFWHDEPDTFSSCVVFSATISHVPAVFPNNLDPEEPPMEPVWVSAHDIIAGTIPIRDTYTGLCDLFRAHAQTCIAHIHNQSTLKSHTL